MAIKPTSEIQFGEDVYQLKDYRIPALTGNANKRIAVNSNGNGFQFVDKDVVYCYYTETDSTNHTGTVSLSIEEINAAISAGRLVVLTQGSSMYYLNWKDNNPIFLNFMGLNVNQISYYASDSKWHKTTTTGTTAEMLVCYLTKSGDTYSCSKTTEEISNAFVVGKVVVCLYNNIQYICQTASSSHVVFINFTNYVIVNNDVKGIGVRAIMYFSSTGWSEYNTMNLQEGLVGSGPGQNIKTINNNSILGSGNISLATSETILCTGELRSYGSTISGSLTQKGNYRIWFNIQNSLTTYNIRVYFSYSGSKWTILLDNSNNSSDFVLPSDVIKYLSVNNTPVEVTRIISTSLQTTEGRTIKAGKRMELEVEYQYYNSTHYLFIKCNYGNIPDTLDNVYM